MESDEKHERRLRQKRESRRRNYRAHPKPTLTEEERKERRKKSYRKYNAKRSQRKPTINPISEIRADVSDARGRIQMKAAVEVHQNIFKAKSFDVAATVLRGKIDKIQSPAKRQRLINDVDSSGKSLKSRDELHNRASVALFLNSNTSARGHRQMTRSIRIGKKGLSFASGSSGLNQSIRIASHTTCQKVLSDLTEKVGFKILRGLEDPIRWVNPVPLLHLYEQDIFAFCTALDGVAESSDRHPLNAYLWPAQISTIDPRSIHSPYGQLLVARGVKERLSDPDQVLNQLIHIRELLQIHYPSLKLFHTGDAFELKTEFKIHSQIFPSIVFKTCRECIGNLAPGTVRQSHHEDAAKTQFIIEEMKRAGILVCDNVVSFVANMASAGQKPQPILTQDIIDRTLPDVLHLMINTCKYYFIEISLSTIRSKCGLRQQMWEAILEKVPQQTLPFFQKVEEYAHLRATSVSCSDVNIHLLGKDAKLLLQLLPNIFLNLRLDFCRRADPRNNPAFRQKFNSMLLVLLVMRRLFFLLQQTTVKMQDKAFSIITHWPHLNITSSTLLIHADSNLLTKILRLNITPDLITDSFYSLLYSSPLKNDLARASGITLGACQMQTAENCGGRAASMRRLHSNNLKNTSVLLNDDGVLLKKHFLSSLAQRHPDRFYGHEPNLNLPSHDQSDDLQLHVTLDVWMIPNSLCIFCIKNHAEVPSALCTEIETLVSEALSLTALPTCEHWKDAAWLAAKVIPPTQRVSETYQRIVASMSNTNMPQEENNVQTGTPLVLVEDSEATSVRASPIEVPTTQSALDDRSISITRTRRCGKCHQAKSKNHRCPASRPTLPGKGKRL